MSLLSDISNIMNKSLDVKLFQSFNTENFDTFIERYESFMKLSIYSTLIDKKYRPNLNKPADVENERINKLLSILIVNKITLINNYNIMSRSETDKLMERIIHIFISCINENYNNPKKAINVFFTEADAYRSLKTISNKKSNAKSVSPISLLVLYDNSSAIDSILKHMKETTELKDDILKECYNMKPEDKNTQYEYRVLDTPLYCPTETINYPDYFEKSLVEWTVECQSYFTMLKLLTKYRPLVKRDIYNLINGSKHRIYKNNVNEENIYRLVFRILKTYRRLYLINAFKEGNVIKKYSIKCNNPNCDNCECNRLKRRGNIQKREIVYTEEENNELNKRYRSLTIELFNMIK